MSSSTVLTRMLGLLTLIVLVTTSVAMYQNLTYLRELSARLHPDSRNLTAFSMSTSLPFNPFQLSIKGTVSESERSANSSEPMILGVGHSTIVSNGPGKRKLHDNQALCWFKAPRAGHLLSWSANFGGPKEREGLIMVRRGHRMKDIAQNLSSYGYRQYVVDLPMAAGQEFWAGISAPSEHQKFEAEIKDGNLACDFNFSVRLDQDRRQARQSPSTANTKAKDRMSSGPGDEANCRALAAFSRGLAGSQRELRGNIVVEYAGRMSNQMIQYLHARLHASKRRMGLKKIPAPHHKSLDPFKSVEYTAASSGRAIPSDTLCGGKYAQNYLWMRRQRSLAKCLFSPRFRAWKPIGGLKLQGRDVVIHIRDPLVDQRKKDRPGYALGPDYFAGILGSTKHDRVFIITQPNMYQHATVKALQARFQAQLYKDSPSGDWSLAVMAPVLIGSFGTFTWMAAFLSEGEEIHLPYISHMERGSFWHPAHNLFIHDDPRIRYHDVGDPAYVTTESAEQVLGRRTVFARALQNRSDWCPML